MKPTMSPYRTIQVHRTAGALGAEVRGLDLSRPMPAETLAELRRAWLENLVIFFRDQKLTFAQYMAFAQSMGRPSIPS
jgi:taurine dioxygenase